MQSGKISLISLFRRLAGLFIVLAVLGLLASLPAVVLAEKATSAASGVSGSGPAAIGHSRGLQAVGEPLPHIQCPDGYTATVYAEGLSSPDGLAFSPAGVLYVAEETAGRVSRIEPDGSATPVLTGLASPEGLAFDHNGTLYVVEDIAGGRVVTLATTTGLTGTLATGLDAPEGIVWVSDDSPAGMLYVTESNIQDVSDNPAEARTHLTAIAPSGVMTRLLTTTAIITLEFTPIEALFWSYAGIAVGPDDALYFTNELSGQVITGEVVVIPYEATSTGGIFTAAMTTPVTATLFADGLFAPEGLRFSTNRQFPLYVAEEDVNGSGRLSRVEADGSRSSFCTGFSSIEDVVLDANGRLFVSEDGEGRIVLIEPEPVEAFTAQAIVLLIGDGMGQGQRTAARWQAVGQSGELAMDAMPYSGWAATGPAGGGVTDSAAAATALATGVKTTNGVLGQDPGGVPLTTIMDQARAKGKALGLVSTVQMAHATPAAFAAHVPSRYLMTEIAGQMLAAEVDLMLGGGEDEFLPLSATGCYTDPGKRVDGRNLITEATNNGYTYVCDGPGLSAVAPASTPRLLGLFSDEEMPRPYSPSLADMTQKAIDLLSQDSDGFFLMVEGGQIDWAGHDNDAATTISDTIDFDEAVAVAKSYASSRDDVLIIVTGDHETGGMSVSLTSTGVITEDGPFYMPDSTPFYVNWSTTLHTGADVPVTAQGPCAELLVGTYENTYIYEVMRTALYTCTESSPPVEPPLESYLPLIIKN